MEGSHAGEHLASVFIVMREDWQILQKWVFLILKGSSANQRKNLIKILNLSCFAQCSQFTLDISKANATIFSIIPAVSVLKLS